MTGFVFRIREQHPQHWDHARDSGHWDFKVAHAVSPGDVCFFVVNRQALVGRAVATSERIKVSAEAGNPWEDAETYPYRVMLERFEVFVGPRITPEDLEGKLGRKLNPRSSSKLNATELRILDDLFAPSIPGDMKWLAERLAVEYGYGDVDLNLHDFTADQREFTPASIVLRRGQKTFRTGLMRAYEATCAVTGSRVESILEAAHISPYKGAHSDRVQNGLLLRSDIHTLFDLHRLTVTPEFVVRLHPDLLRSEYGPLDGQQLSRVPSSQRERPLPKLLQEHNALCTRLDASAARAHLKLHP